MGLFDFLQRGKVTSLQSQVQQLQALVNQKQANSMTVFPTWEITDNAERYCTTDDVYSVIKLIAGTAAQIPIYTYIKEKNGDKTDAPEGDWLNMLINEPLEGMSGFEAVYTVAATVLAQGEAIIWKERPELGPNKGKVAKLHYMHPQAVNIKVTDTFPRRIVAYQYAPMGEIIIDNIPVEEIIHIKYFNPKLSYTGNELRGLSPLQVLTKRLTRVDANMDVTTAQLQNGGVPGVIFEKTPGAVLETASKRRDNWYRFIGNTANKGAPYFTADELGYFSVGSQLADMEVATLAKLDFKKLCNAYGVSDRLFNNDATGSEVSDKGARLGLYTTAVQPLLKLITDGFERGLKADFKGVKYCIEPDYSEIPELQTDYGQLVTWLEKAWWITPNEKREMMKYGASPLPLFDQYLLPMGLQTVEDMEMIEPPLPNTGDFGKDD